MFFYICNMYTISQHYYKALKQYNLINYLCELEEVMEKMVDNWR